MKILDKVSQNFIGQVEVMKLDSEMPELGINLLRAYQGQGLGTRAINLFVNRLKSIMKVKVFSLTIFSDNYVSQRLAEKMGAIRVGDERDKWDDDTNSPMKKKLIYMLLEK